MSEEAPAPVKRHDRVSMEGMIANANHVLAQALDPKQPLIANKLWQKCTGLCLVSVVEAGFLFAGSLGTGILLKKQEDGTWSPPCAMGLAGVSWGLLVGGAVKDIIVFIFDPKSMDGMCGDTGVRLGGQVNLTLGPWGRNYEGGIGVSKEGATGTISVAFSKGAFFSLSLAGAVLGSRGGVNDTFYDKVTSPKSIVNGDVTMPANRPTCIDEVYDKLAKLATPPPEAPAAEEPAADAEEAK